MTILYIDELKPKPVADRDEIILRPGEPCTAEFRGPQAVEIRALFETNILPMPFSYVDDDGCYAHKLHITRTIEERNPACVVRWA